MSGEVEEETSPRKEVNSAVALTDDCTGSRRQKLDVRAEVTRENEGNRSRGRRGMEEGKREGVRGEVEEETS